MNRNKLKTGLPPRTVEYKHLIGRLDVLAVLEDLGIDFGYQDGKQIMCHCPNLEGNHRNNDANPSFGFNEEKLLYNCFLCGGGNVVSLVTMMRPGETQESAVKYLEQFADLNMTQEDFENKVKGILFEKEEEAPIEADYPPDAIFQYRKIHPYLLDRGISREVIVEMQVGYDEEHDGIVIPHFFMGKLVGWQTRHLRQNAEGKFLCTMCDSGASKGVYANKKTAKYKNTVHFPKVNTLYGYDHLKKQITESGVSSVIVVESPMTVLKLKSLGFHRVVATFGQFSPEQAMLLIALNRVYYWPDSDAAGHKNAERIIDTLAQYTDLQIIPALPGEKGDGGDLDTSEAVLEYVRSSYSSVLFPILSEKKLADLETVKGYLANTK